jgi:DNA-binding CsgD family transcriptional regulator
MERMMQVEATRLLVDDNTSLTVAARPVIERLTADLAETDITVVLDQHASSELGATSAPITDPRTGVRVGAVTLLDAASSANPLLLPVARSAAREIEQRLLDSRSARDRALEERFLRARRRSRAPLAVIGERTLLMNAAASRILRRIDQPALWASVERAVAMGASSINVRPNIDVNLEPVREGAGVAGAVLRLHATGRSDSRSSRPTLGWDALTDSERGLAELVADGLTNKEAAAKLFMSRHTVDTHLRSIYRKLNINSRVDLARVVAHERAVSASASSFSK